MIEALRNRSVNWRIFTDSVFVGVCLTLVKVAGALKVILLARVFGASDAFDSYLIAFLLPSFVGETLAGSLPAALIPALIDVREKQGRAAMDRLISSMAASALAVLTIAALLIAVGSSFVFQVLASGFTTEKLSMTQHLFYALSPMIPLSGLSIVWRAALNAQEEFAAPALAPGFTPMITIGVLIWVEPGTGIWVLALATIVGLTLELICLGLGMRRAKMPLLPRWYGWDPAVRAVAAQHLPLVAVATIANGSVLVDQSMAATLGPGSVSALNYGTRLSSVLAGIAGGAISTAALPQFARMISTGDWTGVRHILRTYTRLIALAVVPMTLILVAVSPFLVRTLFLRGAFTLDDATMVTAVQRLSFLQIPVVILNALLFRLVASMQASRMLLRMAAGALLLNIVGDYSLRQVFGLTGIPMTNGLVQIASLAYLWWLVRERVNRSSTC